jgi:hypothetical protein
MRYKNGLAGINFDGMSVYTVITPEMQSKSWFLYPRPMALIQHFLNSNGMINNHCDAQIIIGSQHGISTSQSVAHKGLSTLPALLSVKSLPFFNSSNLNANHLLVAVFGFIVAHSLGLFNPRIPDNNIVQIVANNIEFWTGAGHDRCGVLWHALVDTINFSQDRDLGVRLYVSACVEHFVNVGDTGKASDLGGGNVLDL